MDNLSYGSNPDKEGQTLSKEKQTEINMKVDDIIYQISAEYTYSSDDYALEKKQLNKTNASLDREIEILKLMKTDNSRYSDNFDIILDEYCNKFYPDNRPEFKSFGTLPTLQKNLNDFKIKNSDINILYPPGLSINDMQLDVINLIKDCKQKSKFIKNEYLAQYQELNSIIEALKNRPVDFQDNLAVENCLQRRLQIMRGIGNIRSIQLPIQTSEKDIKIKSLGEVFAKFDSFFNEIELCKQNRNYNNQPQLEISPFQKPNEPRCIKKSIPSDELVKFAEDLNSVIEQTKQMIPLEWINSITQTYRSLLNLKRYEINSSYSNISFEETPAVQEVKDEDVQFDMSSFDKFRETFQRKLPDQLSSSLDTKRVALEIPIPENSSKNGNADNQNMDLPLNLSKNFLNRIKTTNIILRELASREKIGVPQLKIPKPPEINQPDIDSKSLIEKVNEVLSPEQQSIRYLKGEIERLNARIEELSDQTTGRDEEEDDDDDNSESLQSIEEETALLSQTIESFKAKHDHYEELIAELREKRDKIKSECESLNEYIESNELTDEIVNEFEKNYQTKKEEFEQKKTTWKELIEIQNQLRAKS